MAKELCKLKKHLKKDFDAYTLLVNNPKFVCKKCGRAANGKKVFMRSVQDQDVIKRHRDPLKAVSKFYPLTTHLILYG